MQLFDIDKPVATAELKAVSLLKFANQTAEQILSAYTSTLDSIWYDAAIQTIAEVQEILDAMDAIKPGSAARAFQFHAGLGMFIAQIAPDKVTADSVKSPIDYKVDTSGGYPRIVLNPDAEYPRITREKAATKAAMLAEAERLKEAANQ